MNRCLQWMMNAMERVKMSKEPKPRLQSAKSIEIASIFLSCVSIKTLFSNKKK